MAKYQELAGELRAAIERGDYAPGETIPKQEELARAAGVNIKTVKAAVDLLQREGLVTAVRKRGTVVRERPALRRRGMERYDKRLWMDEGTPAFGADRDASGADWSPANQTQVTRVVPATSEVAEGLAIKTGSSVLERARLIVDAAGSPTHTLTSYYRLEDVEGTSLAEPTPGPAGGRGGGLRVLTDQGLEPESITERLHARMPSVDELDELSLPSGEPVVVLTRVIWADGRPVEFARGVHRASRFEWEYHFEIPDTRREAR